LTLLLRCAVALVLGGGFRPLPWLVRAVARINFDGGFRPPTPGYFLLSRQKKLTKEKATRLPRPAGSLRFSPESALAYAPSLARRRGQAIHGLSPSGFSRFGLRCSARQTGERRKVKIKTQNQNRSVSRRVRNAHRILRLARHWCAMRTLHFLCARSAHLTARCRRRAVFAFLTPLSRRATQPGAELPAGGAPWMARILPSAHGRAVGRTRPGRVAQGTAIAARHRGGLSFR
jgi:hypothetical protein